jgi:integrase
MKEVDAVKTKEEIIMIERMLRTHHGDLYADIWRIGVNLSLRISDLLAIRYMDLDLDSCLYAVREGKTGKVRHIRLNNTALTLIQDRTRKFPNDDYLFQVHANRVAGMVKPVSRISVARVFKDVGERIGIKLGTHSMRKSRGWAMFSDGVSVEKISKVLNHSAPSVTMAYLGITKEEILDTYLAYEL